jgi:CRISPR-associated protein Cmr5
MPHDRRLTKHQQQARRAYEQVGALWNSYRTAANEQTKNATRERCRDYRVAVKALGANILRSGLSAALAELSRRADRVRLLREHIAASQIPGLDGASEAELLSRVNALDAGAYMLATRETLQVVMWLKRASEALFEFKPDTDAGSDTAGADGDSHAQ